MTPERVPHLTEAAVPPCVLGTAALTHGAYAGASSGALLAELAAFHAGQGGDAAALALDAGLVWQLAFQRETGLRLQAEALARTPLFRVAPAVPRAPRQLRLLALMQPGDLMANAPLDFLTRTLDVRLDLLFLQPGTPLPTEVPDHDVAFCAFAEADGSWRPRLAWLHAHWPRPMLNDPLRLPLLARDALPHILGNLPGLLVPACVPVTREALLNGRPVPGFEGGLYPALLRPVGSHAGQDLHRLTGPEDLARALAAATAPVFFLTRFVDYASPDGLYRKYRIAFIDGAPQLCHMAISRHWMVHYLNAGMTECVAKRDEEARAMAGFAQDFARRHAAALVALQRRLSLDLWSIDCAEAPDGRLLLFEADTAAILHLLDPATLFPYKPPQMQRVFTAFEAMLRRRAITPALAVP
jgi:hypothetical protein